MGQCNAKTKAREKAKSDQLPASEFVPADDCTHPNVFKDGKPATGRLSRMTSSFGTLKLASRVRNGPITSASVIVLAARSHASGPVLLRPDRDVEPGTPVA